MSIVMHNGDSRPGERTPGPRSTPGSADPSCCTLPALPISVPSCTMDQLGHMVIHTRRTCKSVLAAVFGPPPHGEGFVTNFTDAVSLVPVGGALTACNWNWRFMRKGILAVAFPGTIVLLGKGKKCCARHEPASLGAVLPATSSAAALMLLRPDATPEVPLSPVQFCALSLPIISRGVGCRLHTPPPPEVQKRSMQYVWYVQTQIFRPQLMRH